jgi:deoxyribodipyrimidine photolyase-related protein
MERVGDTPEYAVEDDRAVWALGTHLTDDVGPLQRAPDGTTVLLIEARGFARRKPYHHQKLALVFAAMRQFRDRLREAGYDVEYLQCESFGEGLSAFFDRHDEELLVMRSPSHRSGGRLRELAAEAGGQLRVVPNELFLSGRAAFDEWANGREEPFRHEQFYRWMRRNTGVLMDGDDPVGGEWNYDDRNREFPPEDWEAPPVDVPEHDELTRSVSDWVGEEFDTWGSAEELVCPVTAAGAERRLDHFVAERLSEFGPYQDAMRSDDWAMAHALLGSSLNLGLLHPWTVVERVERAYREGGVPLSSAEGVIRQVLGWREFMRHVYRHGMPELARANQLGATADLPSLYWDGETDMECLGQTVGDVHARGYAHHIQRLMVLANFATLWGVEPAQLNEWFHATYVDAYHWVTTPNVVEMGSYADGLFATKPYVSSANYVDEMSDYCQCCGYDESATTGEDACPFNALYWDFLDRNEDSLRSNHRMALMYGHVDDKRENGELERIRERVDRLRKMAEDGAL